MLQTSGFSLYVYAWLYDVGLGGNSLINSGRRIWC